ncbi:hypothetical protein ACLK1T_13260 [Escherichia coli]
MRGAGPSRRWKPRCIFIHTEARSRQITHLRLLNLSDRGHQPSHNVYSSAAHYGAEFAVQRSRHVFFGVSAVVRCRVDCLPSAALCLHP